MILAACVLKAVKEVEEPGRRPYNLGPLMYYCLRESYCDAYGMVKRGAVLGRGKLQEFLAKAERNELASLLILQIIERTGRLCEIPTCMMSSSSSTARENYLPILK